MIDCSRRTGALAPDLIGGSYCAVELKVNIYHRPDVPHDNFLLKAEMGFPTKSHPPVTREQTD
jgi:hypothetical protein